jgi:hypothetical protein
MSDQTSAPLTDDELRAAAVHGLIAHDASSERQNLWGQFAARASVELLAARAQLDRVRKVHEPIEALNVRYPGGRLTQVCSGCGTDDGNWQTYPCPTIRALNGPRPVAEPREVQP